MSIERLSLHPQRQLTYLGEVDGLRAIAVLAVLLFHLEVSGFSGGYVGVDIFFVFSQGQMIYDDHGKRQLGNMGFGWNQDIRSLDYWQENGDITNVPTLSLTENRDVNSSRHLYDGSYLRLRNLIVHYKLSDRICHKLKVSNLKIFISAQNLYVWTKYNGWDPEVNREGSGAITQGVSYLSPPQAKVFTTGINITF